MVEMTPRDPARGVASPGSGRRADRLKDLTARTAACPPRWTLDRGSDGGIQNIDKRIQDIDKKVSGASHGGDLVASLADLTS
jgi:hypothetical protein